MLIEAFRIFYGRHNNNSNNSRSYNNNNLFILLLFVHVSCPCMFMSQFTSYIELWFYLFIGNCIWNNLVAFFHGMAKNLEEKLRINLCMYSVHTQTHSLRSYMIEDAWNVDTNIVILRINQWKDEIIRNESSKLAVQIINRYRWNLVLLVQTY